MKKSVIAIALTLALVLALAACGAKGTMTSEPLEETSGVKVVMENAGDGAAVSSDLTMEEGQVLICSPDLKEGSVEVKIFEIEREPTADDMGIGDEPVLEIVLDGCAMSDYELQPGDYMMFITAKDNPTGALVIFPESSEELQAQNESLAEAMDQAGAEMPEESDS